MKKTLNDTFKQQFRFRMPELLIREAHGYLMFGVKEHYSGLETTTWVSDRVVAEQEYRIAHERTAMKVIAEMRAYAIAHGE